MPDMQDVWTAHEEYVRSGKQPPLAVGELIAFKQGKKEGWDFGWAYFANPKEWKPSDPIGNMVTIRRCPRNFGEPMLIENCIHVKDPLYEYDTTGTRSCWEKVGIAAHSLSDMASLYNQLLEELQKAKIAEGELVKIRAELEQVKMSSANATSDLSKLSSQVNQMKTKKEPVKEAA